MARAAKRVQQPFDLEQGRFALSPRYAVVLALVGASVATSVAAVHYRLGTAEEAMTRTVGEIKNIRVEQQTKAEAKLECLQYQIANKGWKCPHAIQQQATETKGFRPTMGAWRVTTKGAQ